MLNIGGISNISVLEPQQTTIGYDVSVGNALMDSWIELHQAKRYDKNAEWAKTGTLIPALLDSLLDEPFSNYLPRKAPDENYLISNGLQKIGKFNRLSP